MPVENIFCVEVASETELRELVPPPARLVLDKVLDHADAHIRHFIRICPYAMIATTDSNGVCDESPRGGAPGFIQILDDRHLLIVELPGNRRADSLCNLLENPSIGMLLLVPGYDETLRINGRAVITKDGAILSRYADGGAQPVAVKPR